MRDEGFPAHPELFSLFSSNKFLPWFLRGRFPRNRKIYSAESASYFVKCLYLIGIAVLFFVVCDV